MKKYDLILIEPMYWSWSHYNICTKNLADILVHAGFKIAVVDYHPEKNFHKNQNYDIININIKYPLPNVANLRVKKGYFYKQLSVHFLLLYKKYRYYSILFDKIKNLSDNFYFGTLTLDSLPIIFIKNRKRIFFWGFRSFYLGRPFMYFWGPSSRVSARSSMRKSA